MAQLNKKYFVDGKAEEVRVAIQFDKYKLDPASLTVEEIDKLLCLPEMDTGCLVRTNPNKSGSAFSQMYEHCVLAGFIRSHEGIKALVIFTERPDADNRIDYGFVPIKNIKVKRVHKPKKVKVELAPSEKKVPSRTKVVS